MLESRLRNVFASVLGVEPSRLSDADSPETIAGWDSVNHIQLCLAVEAEFGIELDPDELAGLNSFQAFRERLENPASEAVDS